MQKNRVKGKQSYFSRHFLSILIVISVMFLWPDITLSATKYYYYLQAGSFRIKKDAIKFIEKIEKHEYKVVAKYKKIADQGHWYIVYIGPLSSKKEVKLTIRSLRKKKLARYIAVHQKRSLISSNLMTRKRTVDEKATKAEKPSVQVSTTKMTKLTQRGIGRNIAGKNFALGYRHLYREVGTEVTKRKQIFLEAGVGYKEFSSTSFVYGGGLQLSLFEVKRGIFKGFYSSLSGAYLSGDVEYEYRSPAGNKWNKEAEFKELSVKGELGIIRSRFAVYLGAVFLDYNESTKRDKLTGLVPPVTSFIYEDELENENSFGGFAGVEIYLTPSALIKVEGHVISKESIFIALEYHF